MEYGGLISAAVDLVSGAARGAADSIGAGAGTAVSDLVRARLGTTDEGRAALAGVDADPAATDGLRAALRDALAADPDFAARLAEALAGPPPQTPAPEIRGSVVIDGKSRVRNSTISLGPVTIDNTRTTRLSLWAVAVVLVALVTLATYGTVHLIGSDASPESGRPLPETTGGPGASDPAPPDQSNEDERPADAVLADADMVLQVLPDLTALPPGWSQPNESTAYDAATIDRDEARLELPEHVPYAAWGGYKPTSAMDQEGADILVWAYESVETASTGFSRLRDGADESVTDGTFDPASLPAIGDESVAYHSDLAEGYGQMYTIARIGSVICEVSLVGYTGFGEGYEEDAVALTQLVVARAEQALSGQVPSAVMP